MWFYLNFVFECSFPKTPTLKPYHVLSTGMCYFFMSTLSASPIVFCIFNPVSEVLRLPLDTHRAPMCSNLLLFELNNAKPALNVVSVMFPKGNEVPLPRNVITSRGPYGLLGCVALA